ncbi:MAG: OsmC family peroxiredoxin [Ignavibacteriae bacterium HGW-Ignavibacteriae-4]|jgi:osmotically inducible protein OsmC|nr:MAG: OsmC family peroxiredoxin [Ignavibacteriae bacterium HGW-Ignavibacteriae-4]
MKFSRNANANWKGTGKEGTGTLTTDSSVLKDSHYSFSTRFENAAGTNPEELIGAALSGCFTMQLSFLLDEKGFNDKDLTTDAKVNFEDGSVTSINLDLVGSIKGIDQSTFEEIANNAKAVCPISKLLNADITLTATLK